jgi:hypothetical protein
VRNSSAGRKTDKQTNKQIIKTHQSLKRNDTPEKFDVDKSGGYAQQ